MNCKINNEKLAVVAEELKGTEKYNDGLHAQINYDMEDGDIWVDWVYGSESWVQYHSADIIELSWDDVLVCGVKDYNGGIDYVEGLKGAIELGTMRELH